MQNDGKTVTIGSKESVVNLLQLSLCDTELSSALHLEI